MSGCGNSLAVIDLCDQALGGIHRGLGRHHDISLLAHGIRYLTVAGSVYAVTDHIPVATLIQLLPDEGADGIIGHAGLKAALQALIREL